MKVLIIAFFYITLAAHLVAVQDKDVSFYVRVAGDTLLGKCSAVNRIDTTARAIPTNNDAVDYINCISYMSAVADSNSFMTATSKNAGFNFCLPDEVTQVQMARIVVKYGNDHPEQLHYGGIALAVMSLANAFPCK